jgi:uncharacterized membrane protein YjgN (DUF898 family)
MGIEAQLKDCPSCGSAIAESAVKCTVCKSGLGHCVGCNGWIVVGTQCFDCGKSTAIRVRQAAAAAEKEPAKVRFDASPIPLLPLLFIRFVLTAACGGAIVLAVAASPFGAVAKAFTDHGVPSAGGWPVLWGAAAMLHVAAGFSGTLIRRFRVSHTTLQGHAVEVTLRPGLVILDLVITVLVMALTAGLGLPWLFSRYRRSFYRSCRLPARGGINLGFQGSGEEVLGRFLLTLVLLPFALLTGGLIFGVISWIWLKWDLANLLVPDKYGTLRPVAFRGTMGAYLGRWTMGWLLTLVTGGIYRPWARIAEWRWAAEQTDLR